VNLAVFVSGFPSSREEWFVPAISSLVHGLSRHFSIHVYSLKHPRRLSVYRWQGLPVASFGHPKHIWVGPGRLRACVDAARQVHRQEGFDAVLTLWGDESALAAAMVARQSRLPFLLKLSGGELASIRSVRYGARRSFWQRFCLSAAVRSADLLVAGSLRQQAELKRLGFPGAGDSLVLPFGVDIERFSPGGGRPRPSGDSGPVQLLAVGSLIRVKGFDLLLRAMAGLHRRHPGLRLRIIGDGPERQALEALAAGLGLEDVVTWSGWVDHLELPQAYRDADLMVSSSLHEVHGVACLEAMASGLPVVGSDVGVLPELLEASAAGIICSAGDGAALAGALEMALGNRERWPAMGAAGREAVCRYAAQDRVLKLWRDTVEVTLMNSGGGGPQAGPSGQAR
jgi:glycosyltransferase involved in cell wall biosynthesis